MMTTKDNVLSKVILTLTEYDPDVNVVQLHSVFAKMKMKYGIDGEPRRQTLTITGSSTELRIKTAHSCIEDVDVMVYYGEDFIAVRNGDRPKGRINTSYDSLLDIFKMVSNPEYRGYVTLCPIDRMKWDKNLGRYLSIEKPRSICGICKTSCFYATNKRNRIPGVGKIKGPATRFDNSKYRMYKTNPDIDFVECIRCSRWPEEAQHFFINRERRSGWPPKQLATEAVNVECDVVPVAHPKLRSSCSHQWRISFSRAEIILIRSWNLVRQLLYHLFRYFIKRTLNIVSKEECIDNEEKCIVSGYHLKTLMLWMCEIQDETFWNETQLFRSLSVLISRLIQCVSERTLNNYFIPDCNLFSGSEMFDENHVDEIVALLTPFIHTENLMDWFIDEYLLQSPELFIPALIVDLRPWTAVCQVIKTNSSSWLCRRIIIGSFLEKLKRPIALNACQGRMYFMRAKWQFYLQKQLDDSYAAALDFAKECMNDISRVGRQFFEFFQIYTFLSLKVKLQKFGSSCIKHDFIDFVLALLLRDSNIDFRQSCATYSNVDFDDSPESYLLKAINILILRKRINRGTEILHELAKWCLVEASKSSEFSSVARVYMATLCLEENEEMLALELCSSVALTNSLAPEQYRIEDKVLPDCLDLSIALGLHDHVASHIHLHQNLQPCQLTFTPRMFAFFILLSCLCKKQDFPENFEQFCKWSGRYVQFLESSSKTMEAADLCLHGLLVSRLRNNNHWHIPFQSQMSNNQNPSAILNCWYKKEKMTISKKLDCEERKSHTESSVFKSWSLRRRRRVQTLSKCSDEEQKDFSWNELHPKLFESLRKVESFFLSVRSTKIVSTKKKSLVYDRQRYEDEMIYRRYMSPNEKLVNIEKLIELFLCISAEFSHFEEFKAFNCYRTGDCAASLNICNKFILRENEVFPFMHIFQCSAPFDEFFDADLKSILSDSEDEMPMIVLMLYLKIRCLLELNGPCDEIRRSIFKLADYANIAAGVQTTFASVKYLTSFLARKISLTRDELKETADTVINRLKRGEIGVPKGFPGLSEDLTHLSLEDAFSRICTDAVKDHFLSNSKGCCCSRLAGFQRFLRILLLWCVGLLLHLMHYSLLVATVLVVCFIILCAYIVLLTLNE